MSNKYEIVIKKDRFQGIYVPNEMEALHVDDQGKESCHVILSPGWNKVRTNKARVYAIHECIMLMGGHMTIRELETFKTKGA